MNLKDFDLTTLTETSKDKQTHKPLVTSSVQVYNFDKIKNEYVSKKCQLSQIKKEKGPMSADALYVDENRNILFEFKSGKLGDTQKIYDIHKKVYDSFIILCDLLNEHLTETIRNDIFVLVYDDSKVGDKWDKKFPPVYSERPALNDIISHVMMKSGRHLVKFDLLKYKGYLFKDVYTISKDNFGNEIKELGIQ